MVAPSTTLMCPAVWAGKESEMTHYHVARPLQNVAFITALRKAPHSIGKPPAL